jgi:hypothetical protein
MPVTTVLDHLKEKKETLTMTLSRGSGYKLSTHKKAKLTIVNAP